MGFGRFGGRGLFPSFFRRTVDPSSATIQSSILSIPCKTLSPSPLPCYPLPCTPNPIPARPSRSRIQPMFRCAPPNLLTFQPAIMPTMFKLLPNHTIPALYSLPTLRPRKSFSCSTYGPPRKCCKQKTCGISNSFRCNTYKKTGGGVPPASQVFSRGTESTAEVFH